MKRLVAVTLALGLAGCWDDKGSESKPVRSEKSIASTNSSGKVVKTDAEWRAQLTKQQYEVTREKGTERCGTGAYVDNHEVGTYSCICCDQPLFTSDTKFESGSGWPSFFQPVDKNAVTELEDTSHGMMRVEVQCSRCDAHLGHVFPDGPKPTGRRYCMNSVALKFTKK